MSFQAPRPGRVYFRRPREVVVNPSSVYAFSFGPSVSQVELTLDGTIEVTHRTRSETMNWLPNDNPPDRVWKEIYRAVDGKIVLAEIIDGEHIPTQVIPETITFPTRPNPEEKEISGVVTT